MSTTYRVTNDVDTAILVEIRIASYPKSIQLIRLKTHCFDHLLPMRGHE